ncbi:unnamed protein product, partial [Meganyctiphanes norvegica]
AEKLTSNLPTPLNSATHYLKDRINNYFFTEPIISNDISKTVNKLKNNGKGANIVSILVLKHTKDKLSDMLTHIFNKCFADGCFPNELKTGCITPVYKSGSKGDINQN